jgi:hypothetical protein
MFKIIHIIIKRSAKGSVVILWKNSFNFNQQGQQFQIKRLLVNLCQHNGHFFLDFLSSERKEKKLNIRKWVGGERDGREAAGRKGPNIVCTYE